MSCSNYTYQGLNECADNWRGVKFIPWEPEIKMQRTKAKLIETIQDKMINVINYFE